MPEKPQIDPSSVQDIVVDPKLIKPQTFLPAAGDKDPFGGMDKGVFIHNKIGIMENSDIFKKATPQQKINLYQRFYNSYIVPFNQEKGEKGTQKDFIKSRIDILGTRKTGNQPQADKSKIAMFGVAKPIVDAVTAAYNISGSMDRRMKKEMGYKGDGDIQDWFKLPTVGVEDGKFKVSMIPWKEVADRFEMQDKDVKAKTLADKAVYTSGYIVGSLPFIKASSAIVEGIGLNALVNPLAKGALGVPGKMVAHATVGAADGYLFGKMQNQDGEEMAKWGAGLGALLPGLQFLGSKGVKAFMAQPWQQYMGKVVGSGGISMWGQQVNSTMEAIGKGAVESTVEPAIVAKVGSPKQKIHAATIQMLNELTPKGNFVNASPAEKRAAILRAAEKAPQMSDELSWFNKELDAWHSGQSIKKQVAENPAFGELLGKFEALDGVKASEDISNSKNSDILRNRVDENPAGTFHETKPGAASPGGMEWGANVSKAVDGYLSKLGLGPDKFIIEKREFKLALALNQIIKEQETLGANADRNKLFTHVFDQLQQMFPKYGFKELKEVSDNAWNHMEQLKKAGMINPEGATRIFRQTEIRPGESPFGHQLQLAHDAQARETEMAMDEVLRNTPEARDTLIEAAKNEILSFQERIKVLKTDPTPEGTAQWVKANEQLSEAEARYRALQSNTKYTPTKTSIEGSGKLVETVSAKKPKIDTSTKAGVKADQSLQAKALEMLHPGKTDMKGLTMDQIRKVLSTANDWKIGKKPVGEL